MLHLLRTIDLIGSCHPLFQSSPPYTPPPPLTHIGWIIEDQMEKDWKATFVEFPRLLIDDIPSLI